MNCSRHDLVLLPIPFTDLSSRKVRPAIVIGFGTYPGDLFVVPLTSQLDNADFALAEWQAAGLNVPSGIKSQLATVESTLVLKIVGHLSPVDASTLDVELRRWLSI
jgi:mRNA interferase MazF